MNKTFYKTTARNEVSNDNSSLVRSKLNSSIQMSKQADSDKFKPVQISIEGDNVQLENENQELNSDKTKT